MFFRRWFGREREARRLNRDAVAVIEMALASSTADRVRAAALLVDKSLREAHERGGDDPARYGPLLDHFKMQHREARRRIDDAALTAMTLVIIYLRAEMLGEGSAPAREAIDALIAQWAHAAEGDDTGAGPFAA